MAVNAAEDNAGRNATNQQAFALHHLLHTNFALMNGVPLAPEFIKGFGSKKADSNDRSDVKENQA